MTALAALILMSLSQPTQTPDPVKPFGAVPHQRQLDWQKLEYYAFIHFGPNTFTDKEWGEGKEDPNVFNPTQLDCRQWAKAIKDAGMKAVIITAKHHDGFCLWPSKLSSHTVANSNWRDGKGDVLRDLSDACKEFGLKLGVYLSPWDRNHPTYGTPEYNHVFAKMLTEVLTQYGPIFEVWFDGANGEGPNGKRQVYDWELFIRTVRKHQPNAVIFSDAGPDVRWVGNESGHSAETCWSTINRSRYTPGTPHYKELTEGTMLGTDWVPAECDVSIRPGWFYHASEDNRVKTVAHLEDLYYRSVGQNGSLLLNLPPDRRGLIHENDIASLIGLRKRLDQTFKVDYAKRARVATSSQRGSSYKSDNLTDDSSDSFWAPTDSDKSQTITLTLELPTVIDRILVQEQIALGQRVTRFSIETEHNGETEIVARGTTVGYKRIVRIEPVLASKVRITILDSLAIPTISNVSLYATPEALAHEINLMAKGDQEIREQLTTAMNEKKELKEIIRRMKAVDERNQVRMKQIVRDFGYPTKSLVGLQAYKNAFLLIQHSDTDVEFQEECLALMSQAAISGDASPRDVAYLTDRVLVGRGKPQRFGTQLTAADESLAPIPSEDEAGLDKRRAEFGMEPMSAYLTAAARAKRQERPVDEAVRFGWWREAKFGLFIHWGVYAVAASQWSGKDYGSAAEWLLNHAKIKPADYFPLGTRFNPVNFNADEWVRIAKEAGFRYIVITTKHHDGFALWPTKQNDWNVMNTPFGRDILKELKEACKRQSMPLGFYYSIMDWTHPDYLPRREWDDRPTDSANFNRYLGFMKAQLTEILTNYGEIPIVWFDGHWEGTYTEHHAKEIFSLVRALQPRALVNNRVDKGPHTSLEPGFAGDYATPEQSIPAGKAKFDWEVCMTMNKSWGYSLNDNEWKSSETLIKNLCDIVSKGGNYLLNVGPMPDGTFEPKAMERIREIGAWMKRNGEAIYGTTAGPSDAELPWGRISRKGHTLYLMVFRPFPEKIEIEGFDGSVASARSLSSPNAKVEFTLNLNKLTILLPPNLPDEAVTVIRLTRHP